MIDKLLRNPAMRDGPVPGFDCRDEFFDGMRVKRVRQWSLVGEPANLLPWIALNPSGVTNSGRGLSGRTMARLAYLWGFDGVATYNIVPFEGSKPKRDIWPALRREDQAVGAAIQRSHDAVASHLIDADAAVVAWGSHGGALGRRVTQLARHLVHAIRTHAQRDRAGFNLWHVGLNGNGSPKHAGSRGRSAIPNLARPMPFIFDDPS